MKFLAALVAVLGCLLLAACGGQHAKVTTTPPAPAPQSRCVDGNSFMGCSLPAPGLKSRNLTVPAGRKFIDVSDWQPDVNWKAVKASGVFGVIIKAGEGLREDPTYASHLAGARAAGLQVQVYWFIRNVGCTSEAAAINHVVAHGLRVNFDAEVPEAAGYVACLKAPVQSHTGVVPADYTSPGSWPGGSNGGMGLWQAEFGPTLHPFWHPVLAWQYTDAASVAGLSVDESVDYGLFPKPAPANPVCITHRITRAACVYNKAHIAQYTRAAASSERAFKVRGCDVLRQRVSWFTTQLRKHPKVKAQSRRSALRASQRAYTKASCPTYAQRQRYFAAKAAKLKAAS